MIRGRLAWAVRGRGRVLALSRTVLRVGCRLRSPSLVAFAWSLGTGPIEHHVVDERPPRRPAGARDRRPGRIVLLPKAGGSEDFRDAADTAGADDGLELCGLPRDHVRAVFEAIVGEDAFPSLTDTDYRVGDTTFAPAKERYRRFLVRVVRRYARRLRAVGFVTSNLSFRAERELAAACVEAGVGFVALHKESIRTSAQRHFFTRAYAELLGPFEGSALGVYNADERTSILESSMAPEERVQVVGCPRMDPLHRIREQRAGQRPSADAPVVLFAIDEKAGTWTPYDGREDTHAPRWERLAALTDEAFVAAARSMPERRFVIKVKIGREAQQLARLPDDPPVNLYVVSSGIGTALLEEAAVVIGFNSTVLLEALAVGAPTLVPRYAEAADPAAGDWLFDLSGAVEEIHALEELAPAISRALGRGPSEGLSGDAVAALERYVGNADGRASARAWAFLREAFSRDR